MQSLSDNLNYLRSLYSVVGEIICDDQSLLELYEKLNRLYQPAYTEYQRIVCIITKDYHNGSEPGETLKYLQSIISDLDISNYFVTIISTNPNIKDDYHKVFREFSIDPTPCTIYQCVGSYDHVTKDNQDFIPKKRPDILKNLSNLSKLSGSQKKILTGKYFCMMPWVGIHVSTDSKVKPCCSSTLVMGNCSQDSIKDLWNAKEVCDLRQQMINNQLPQSCETCHVVETGGQYSLRMSVNDMYLPHANLVDFTREDGTLDIFEIKHWDIRYNNLCNLACRMCNSKDSSSWQQADVYLGLSDAGTTPIKIAGNNEKDLYKQLVQHIDKVETIYFAGGEPLIIDQFYKILEDLINLGRRDVVLKYNTNLTRLKLKSLSILDLWKEFADVTVAASLDAEYQRGEYLRQNTRWDDVIQNRREMLVKTPHVAFYVSPTVSLLNALHLPDFHRSWVDSGLITPDQFEPHILHDPEWMRVDTAPKDIKSRLFQKYHEHLEWLEPRDTSGRATNGFKAVLKQIGNDNVFDPEIFWNQIKPLDKFYRQDFDMTFPELCELPR